MCKFLDQCEAEFQRFHATGELPPAWEPEVTDAEFDRRVDEINRELEAIENDLPQTVRRVA